MATSGTRDVIDKLEHLLWERRSVARAEKLGMSFSAALSDACFQNLLGCRHALRHTEHQDIVVFVEPKSSSKVQFIDMHAARADILWSWKTPELSLWNAGSKVDAGTASG